MAELVKSFVTLDKDSGSGNGTVTASANSQNTGRSVRQLQVTFKAPNCADLPVTIRQLAKGEATSIQGTGSVVKTGGTLTLTGVSNSKKLTFTKGTDNIGLTLPSTYTAGGVETQNGADISGDPGNTAEYNFSLQMSVPANAGIEAKTCQIIVTDDGGNAYTCTITLAAGDATLSVSPTTIELPWDGSTTASVTVTTNTSYTIE